MTILPQPAPAAQAAPRAHRLAAQAANYRRARRKAAIQALLLALPLLVFLLATFIAPIAILLARSVRNPEVPGAMPELARVLRQWDGRGVPDEAAFAALATGLRASAEAGSLGEAARRMN
ncbi:ABC transporter permease, partial [Burkholderia gladioli]|nr:ABC transporter permease [Burkholderia gladioli]